MTEELDSLDRETADLPTGQTLQGKIESITKGVRADFRQPDEDGNWGYDEAESGDSMIELVAVAEHDGHEFRVVESFNDHENPSPRSVLGQLINKYGKLEVGSRVDISFDSDGNTSIVR